MVEFLLVFLTGLVAGLVCSALRRRDGKVVEPLAGRTDPPEQAREVFLRSVTPAGGFFGAGAGSYQASNGRGRVYLVGAGPGEPGLLTIKGKRSLEKADVIIYDYLVNESLLTYCRAGAERIHVGKPGSEQRLSQQEINRLLIERAQEGKVVVRLKGGDPFIFSRGGEEAEALVEAGVSFEVIPGVTSAIAVPGYAGIPLTHRELASTVVFVTGHEDGAKEASGIDWKAVAGMGTAVFLMGVRHLSQIVARLIEEGRAPETPVAVIQWGTLPRQKTVVGTLQDIREKGTGIGSPAIIVVGEVVRLRDRLKWFEEAVSGRRTAVTGKRKPETTFGKLAQRPDHPWSCEDAQF